MAKRWISDKRIIFPLAALIGAGLAAGLIAAIDRDIALEHWQLAATYAVMIVAAVFLSSKIPGNKTSAPPASAQEPPAH